MTGHNHLVDISPLNGAPEIIDTLNKYPQLQVYRVFNDKYSYGMHCHVFYKGYLIFSDDYQLWKSKSDSRIYGDSSFVNTLNLSLTPSIQLDQAIKIARLICRPSPLFDSIASCASVAASASRRSSAPCCRFH